MELTTSYQKLGEAYLGSSAGDLYIRIYGKYSEQDMANNRSKVQYQARAYFSGSYIYDQQSNGNVKGTGANQVNFTKNTNYNNGETTLGTTEAWVTHNADGTMSISASAYLKFPNWGWSATANGTATLPNLHKPPVLQSVVITEQNSTLTGLGVGGDYFVPYLSIKKFKITGTPYDSATITQYEVINKTKVYTSSTDEVTMNLQSNELYTTYVDFLQREVAEISIRLTDNKSGKSTTAYPYNYLIPYKKPVIERANTSIKRKSGNGVNLTDNKASLNLKATFYKGNDAVGNNNSISQIGYKIWESGTSEPGSYTSLTPTISGGNITITNFEISNVDYTKVYNYKIIIKDIYNKEDVIADGVIPQGQSVWTEYKDHVDFLELTVKHSNPFEYSTSETKAGKWVNGSQIYRKVINFGNLPNTTTKSVAHGISGLGQITRIDIIGSDGTYYFPIPFSPVANMYGNVSCSTRIDTTNINIYASGNWSTYTAYVILEYTKN